MESVEDVKANCMAVLISGGGGLTEKQLSSDYRSLVGKPIPFTQLGYSSLRDFIESLGFCITRNNFGESVIKQFYDKNTAHISSLIARQRKKPGSGKGKKRGSLRPSPKYKPPSFKYNYDSSYSHRPQPPKPRYSNPPIIPQRQPFTGSTSKPSYCPPVVSPKKSPSSFPLHHKQSSSPSPNSSVQRRLEIKAPVLDIVAVHSQIVSVDTRGTDSFGESNCAKATDAKEQTMVKEPPEDATFVDIQWLQGKVRSSNKKNVTIPRTDSSHLPSLLDKVIIPPTSKVSPMYTAASPTKTKNLPSLFDKEILPPLRPPSPRGCVVPPNNTQVFKSFVSELFKMTENNKWDEPEYKVLQRRPFKGQSMFTAKVKVGNEIHLSSFPDEKPTAEEAQELVAKLACIELSKRLNQSTPGSESVVNSDFVSRIVEIVGDKSNGMFDDAVASLYLEKFGSKLPDDWLNLLSPQNFTVDKTAGKFIIYPTFTSEVTHQIDLKFNGLDINDNSILDPAVNVPGFVSIERKPAKLTLPDDATWDVFVASVSSNDLWIRFIGDDYDVEYNNMMNNLELELLSKSIKASDFVLDNYYVAKFDNCWLRVQLKEVAVDGSDECLVFLIDNGEVDSVPLSELQVLDDKYLQLPPQAVRCKLTYVDLGYGEAQSYVLTNVLGSTFVAEVLVPPTEDQVLSIVLHNTAVEGSPTNVNSMILEQIISKLDPPTLPMRTLATLHLTHIEEQSLPWVQLESRDLALLELILEDLSRLDLVEIHGLNAHPRPGQNEKESMYLVKSKERPHTWCRGVIVTPDPKSPLVHFIDFGYKQKCYWNEIFDLEKVLPVLKKFPPQAIQITLDGLKVSDITTGVVRRIQELIPDDSPILGKIRDEDLQSVEIFKRVQPGNMLASINSDLIHNFEELSTKATEPMAMDLPRQSVLRAFSTLPTYKPPADDFFDVYVSFSSNPYNFVVQPVKELNTTFNTLMKDMQEYYEAQYDIMPVPVLGDFVQNAVFAAKHPDDLQWYRVSVVQAIGDSMVSIKYVDYGDAGLLSIESIRYLVPRFMMLPALALRAKLHGVQPNAHDWTVEDCVYFNNIVVNKPFVSKVHALNSENVNAWQISLDLIDTSSSCDIHISKKLIDNKIAVLQ